MIFWAFRRRLTYELRSIGSYFFIFFYLITPGTSLKHIFPDNPLDFPLFITESGDQGLALTSHYGSCLYFSLDCSHCQAVLVPMYELGPRMYLSQCLYYSSVLDPKLFFSPCLYLYYGRACLHVCALIHLFQRPSVAGPVLQTPLSLINSFIHSLALFLQIFTPKPYGLGI